MKYVEIAKGTPYNRGILIPVDRLSNHLGEEPVYRSVYLYDDTAFEYVKENGSLKNFFGVRYIDKVPVDIDKQDRSDERTLDILRGIILELEDADIDCGSFQSYFSGSGYHLILSGDLFNFKPGNDLPFIVKQTMKKLMPDIDSSIYMRTGIYRLQHTPNQKTGLYKIPITRNEVMNNNPEEIFELAKTSRLNYTYNQLKGNGEFEDKIVKEVPDVRVFNKISEPTKIIPCVQSMLNQGANEGSRHITAMRIISHFKRHGIPSHYAKVCMLHWNNKSVPEQQIMEMVENVYNRNYKYGCQDSVMVQHCKTQCIHFQRKDYLVDIKSASTMQEELAERLTTDFSGKTINLGRALGLDVESTIYPGELVTIFGPTGSNKTTFAQNLALGVDFVNNRIVKDWQIPTLFLSLELSSWYMHRRHLQVVANKSKDEVNDNYERLYNMHKYSRNEVLDLYAGKGSGAIENASRKVIGLNGQPKSSIRQVRLFKNTDGELFDTAVEWQPSFRLRRTDAFND
jgi:energy-coupling factor transporter ATP-binding protein EcfA2